MCKSSHRVMIILCKHNSNKSVLLKIANIFYKKYTKQSIDNDIYSGQWIYSFKNQRTSVQTTAQLSTWMWLFSTNISASIIKYI